jgi:hypothetical protein
LSLQRLVKLSFRRHSGKQAGKPRIIGECPSGSSLALRLSTRFLNSCPCFCRSIHVVSLVHSVTIVFLAVRVLDLPALEKDRAFAWDDNVGSVIAIAAGYILYFPHTRIFLVYLI